MLLGEPTGMNKVLPEQCNEVRLCGRGVNRERRSLLVTIKSGEC